ncbi:peptide-methionine (S)-S-oxide reductase [Bacillus sp. sid0103]|uniref:peptide-methionine (S)-S-oxide reductase n=1 Tax=Bacillus sp. sid0103 TaxID=2856337 RepID=UPI001C48BABD|nr:peptide-methionine (S)-S-oxide reductase [Bacillus sp. sid0103]MBV7505618.1 peptide-methionine (S)-S-oxide reductase [Bacillus sp. sid0103]
MNGKKVYRLKERDDMERAVFGANEFFSQKAFITGFRGIENVRIGHLKGTNLKIVEVWFNPWKVSYDEIVDLFFDLHDPTSREGQLLKNQSFIFFSDMNQLTVAKQKKNELQHLFNDEIITEITPVWEHINSLEEIKLIS